MKELRPHRISSVTSFSPLSLENLDKDFSDISTRGTVGLIYESGELCFVGKGSVSEVLNVRSGQREGAWSFENAYVSCVCTCNNQLIVGLKFGINNSEPYRGLVCLYNPGVGRVVKAIKLMYSPVSMCMIRNTGGASGPPTLLCGYLKLMFGILAVGTECGHVYLIDLRSDDILEEFPLERPSSLFVIDPSFPGDVAAKRDMARLDLQHLSVDLNYSLCSLKAFKYVSANGQVLKVCPSDGCDVTCLKYLRETGLLVVGFSFGWFQLWNLSTVQLLYSSMEAQYMSPVTHVTFQEPENDPRSCSYLWIGRGPRSADDKIGTPTSVALYQMLFERKEYKKNYGVVYEALESIACRFDHQLTADVYHLADSLSTGSRILCLYTLEKKLATPSQLTLEDGSQDIDAWQVDSTMCYVVWEAPAGDSALSPSCHLGLFDINRWYQMQLPRSVRDAMFGRMDPMCPFFAFYALTDVVEAMAPNGLLDVYIDPNGVARFHAMGAQKEQFFWPASSTFAAVCLSEGGSVRTEMLGLQRQIVADIASKGADGFVECEQTVQTCWAAGLMSRPIDFTRSSRDKQSSEFVLSTSLENGGPAFVLDCIKKWSYGDINNAEHSLKLILNWSWGRAVSRKKQLDKLHTPIFASHTGVVDKEHMSELSTVSSELKQLADILNALVRCKGVTFAEGATELEIRSSVIQYLFQYSQILLALIEHGVLPECCDGSVKQPKYPYDGFLLPSFYGKRRDALTDRRAWQGARLFIDTLCEQMKPVVGDDKASEDREEHVTPYPPTSVEEVCRLFLKNLSEDGTQLWFFYYWMLDVCECHQDLHSIRAADKVTAKLNIGVETRSLVHALWLLDHGLFEDAVELLIQSDLKVPSDIHKEIIKCLYFQDQASLCALFCSSKPPDPVWDRQDVEFQLCVFLQLGMIGEAYTLQHKYSQKFGDGTLFERFAELCRRNASLNKLLELSMDAKEEDLLVKYLQSQHGLEDYLVIFYLVKGKVSEAAQITAKLKKSPPVQLDRFKYGCFYTRNMIVDGFMKVLPEIQRKMLKSSASIMNTFDHVDKGRTRTLEPQPLSSAIKRGRVVDPVTHSGILPSALNAMLESRPSKYMNSADAGPFRPFVGAPWTESGSRRQNLLKPSLVNSVTSGSAFSKKALLARSCTSAVSPAVPAKKRKQLFSSAAACSLLKSPSVRAFKSTLMSSQSIDIIKTPSSILKTRNTSRLARADFFASSVTSPGRKSLFETAHEAKPSETPNRKIRFVDIESPDLADDSRADSSPGRTDDSRADSLPGRTDSLVVQHADASASSEEYVSSIISDDEDDDKNDFDELSTVSDTDQLSLEDNGKDAPSFDDGSPTISAHLLEGMPRAPSVDSGIEVRGRTGKFSVDSGSGDDAMHEFGSADSVHAAGNDDPAESSTEDDADDAVELDASRPLTNSMVLVPARVCDKDASVHVAEIASNPCDSVLLDEAWSAGQAGEVIDRSALDDESEEFHSFLDDSVPDNARASGSPVKSGDAPNDKVAQDTTDAVEKVDGDGISLANPACSVGESRVLGSPDLAESGETIKRTLDTSEGYYQSHESAVTQSSESVAITGVACFQQVISIDDDSDESVSLGSTDDESYYEESDSDSESSGRLSVSEHEDEEGSCSSVDIQGDDTEIMDEGDEVMLTRYENDWPGLEVNANSMVASKSYGVDDGLSLVEDDGSGDDEDRLLGHDSDVRRRSPGGEDDICAVRNGRGEAEVASVDVLAKAGEINKEESSATLPSPVGGFTLDTSRVVVSDVLDAGVTHPGSSSLVTSEDGDVFGEVAFRERDTEISVEISSSFRFPLVSCDPAMRGELNSEQLITSSSPTHPIAAVDNPIIAMDIDSDFKVADADAAMSVFDHEASCGVLEPQFVGGFNWTSQAESSQPDGPGGSSSVVSRAESEQRGSESDVGAKSVEGSMEFASRVFVDGQNEFRTLEKSPGEAAKPLAILDEEGQFRDVAQSQPSNMTSAESMVSFLLPEIVKKSPGRRGRGSTTLSPARSPGRVTRRSVLLEKQELAHHSEVVATVKNVEEDGSTEFAARSTIVRQDKISNVEMPINFKSDTQTVIIDIGSQSNVMYEHIAASSGAFRTPRRATKAVAQRSSAFKSPPRVARSQPSKLASPKSPVETGDVSVAEVERSPGRRSRRAAAADGTATTASPASRSHGRLTRRSVLIENRELPNRYEPEADAKNMGGSDSVEYGSRDASRELTTIALPLSRGDVGNVSDDTPSQSQTMTPAESAVRFSLPEAVKKSPGRRTRGATTLSPARSPGRVTRRSVLLEKQELANRMGMAADAIHRKEDRSTELVAQGVSAPSGELPHSESLSESVVVSDDRRVAVGDVAQRQLLEILVPEPLDQLGNVLRSEGGKKSPAGRSRRRATVSGTTIDAITSSPSPRRVTRRSVLIEDKPRSQRELISSDAYNMLEDDALKPVAQSSEEQKSVPFRNVVTPLQDTTEPLMIPQDARVEFVGQQDDIQSLVASSSGASRSPRRVAKAVVQRGSSFKSPPRVARSQSSKSAKSASPKSPVEEGEISVAEAIKISPRRRVREAVVDEEASSVTTPPQSRTRGTRRSVLLEIAGHADGEDASMASPESAGMSAPAASKQTRKSQSRRTPAAGRAKRDKDRTDVGSAMFELASEMADDGPSSGRESNQSNVAPEDHVLESAALSSRNKKRSRLDVPTVHKVVGAGSSPLKVPTVHVEMTEPALGNLRKSPSTRSRRNVDKSKRSLKASAHDAPSDGVIDSLVSGLNDIDEAPENAEGSPLSFAKAGTSSPSSSVRSARTARKRVGFIIEEASSSSHVRGKSDR